MLLVTPRQMGFFVPNSEVFYFAPLQRKKGNKICQTLHQTLHRQTLQE